MYSSVGLDLLELCHLISWLFNQVQLPMTSSSAAPPLSNPAFIRNSMWLIKNLKNLDSLSPRGASGGYIEHGDRGSSAESKGKLQR